MDYDEAVVILGEADKCNAAIGLKYCLWGNDEKHIKLL